MDPAIDRRGFAIIPAVLGIEERDELREALGVVAGAGRRGVLGIDRVAALVRSSRLIDLVRPYVLAEPFAVRAIDFDKTPGVNWLVPWHQDLTVAVRSRVDVAGFGPWSIKDGIPHVQPPVEILERMLTVRIHLDDADEANGALRVRPGSHRLGRLSPDRIRELRDEGGDVLCAASAGDVLLMRPLILHASGRSTSDRNRRVLHIEFASTPLPGGLEWYERTRP